MEEETPRPGLPGGERVEHGRDPGRRGGAADERPRCQPRLGERVTDPERREDLLDGRRYSAIQLSTAAGLAAVLELYAGGRLGSGFVKQESVKLSDFLSTRWGGRIYAPEEQGVPAEARV